MDQVAEIKNRLEVAEVVGGYIPLKQSGRNLKASCPFHHEKTASFMVSPEKGIWHCFGCGEGGDIFKFVMKMDGLDFRQALEKLAQRAGVELKSSPADRQVSQLKERLRQANTWAVKYFQASLAKNAKALDYLKGRGLTGQTVKDFQIGYAPDSWEGLVNLLKKKGFTDDELIKAGLAGRARSVFDMFRGRMMLPIADASGVVIGFTGRVLDGGEPKYLNTPQTVLYDKSRAIYGLNLAREGIRAANEVILVEGNLDVVASHQAGVTNVVAASGTALTSDQLRALGKLTPNIKLAFDQDKAGLNATERAIELGQNLGLSLKMITISDAKDPDELIKKDPKLWTQAIAQAQYIVDYLFERFEHEFDLSSGMGKRLYSDRLTANIKRLADPVEQDHYIKLLAEKTGSDPESVRKKVEQKAEAKTTAAETPADPQAAPIHDAQYLIEQQLLALAVVNPELRASLAELKPADFSDDQHRQILKALTKDPQARPTPEALSKQLPEAADYVKILALRGEEQYAELVPADRSFEAFKLTRRLQTEASKKAKLSLSEQLRQAEAAKDPAQVQALLAQYQALVKAEETLG